MWVVIRAFFVGNAVKALQFFVLATAVMGSLAAIYRSGGKAQKTKQLELDLRRVGESNAVHDKNRAELADGDAAARLRDDWAR